MIYRDSRSRVEKFSSYDDFLSSWFMRTEQKYTTPIYYSHVMVAQLLKALQWARPLVIFNKAPWNPPLVLPWEYGKSIRHVLENAEKWMMPSFYRETDLHTRMMQPLPLLSLKIMNWWDTVISATKLITKVVKKLHNIGARFVPRCCSPWRPGNYTTKLPMSFNVTFVTKYFHAIDCWISIWKKGMILFSQHLSSVTKVAINAWWRLVWVDLGATRSGIIILCKLMITPSGLGFIRGRKRKIQPRWNGLKNIHGMLLQTTIKGWIWSRIHPRKPRNRDDDSTRKKNEPSLLADFFVPVEDALEAANVPFFMILLTVLMIWLKHFHRKLYSQCLKRYPSVGASDAICKKPDAPTLASEPLIKFLFAEKFTLSFFIDSGHTYIGLSPDIHRFISCDIRPEAQFLSLLSMSWWLQEKILNSWIKQIWFVDTGGYIAFKESQFDVFVLSCTHRTIVVARH